jgi:hypothetical protein
MKARTVAFLLIPLCCLFALSPCGLAEKAHFISNREVLDCLFPKEFDAEPYLEKVVLRFDDSSTELVLLMDPVATDHAPGPSELVQYTLGITEGDLLKRIEEILVKNPQASVEQVASHFKVSTKRVPIADSQVKRVLDELKSIRVSPALGTRIGGDSSFFLNFWYFGFAESVHYQLIGPHHGDPQDELVKWMLGFRERLPELLGAGGPDPNKASIPLRVPPVPRLWGPG